MKLLILFTSRFAYQTQTTSLTETEFTNQSAEIENAIVGFIHFEKEDEDRAKSVERSLVNNLKWAARKNNTQNIVLHSFAHLSDSKADPGFSKQLLDKCEKRIQATGYNTHQTPWGYFLDLSINAPGHSLARIFKSF